MSCIILKINNKIQTMKKYMNVESMLQNQNTLQKHHKYQYIKIFAKNNNYY